MYPFKAVVFDFYKTLVEIDQDTPPMWQTLTDLGYHCTLTLEAMWESDAFNGTTAPRIDDSPSYYDWRRANVRSLVQLSGVPREKVEELVTYLLDIDRRWTVKAIPSALEIVNVLRERATSHGRSKTEARSPR